MWSFIPSPPADQLPPLAQQDVIRTAFIYKSADVTPVGPSTVLTNDSGSGRAVLDRPRAAGAGLQEGRRAPTRTPSWWSPTTLKSKGAAHSALSRRRGGHLLARGRPGCVQRDPGPRGAGREHLRDPGRPRRWAPIGSSWSVTSTPTPTRTRCRRCTRTATPTSAARSTRRNPPTRSTVSRVHWTTCWRTHVAKAMVTGADVWQINAQEAVAFAYSRYNYNATQLFNGTDPFAASDHDPVVVGLNLPVTPVAPAWDKATVYEAGAIVTFNGSTWQALCANKNKQPGGVTGPWEEIATAPDGTAICDPDPGVPKGRPGELPGHDLAGALADSRNQKPGGRDRDLGRRSRPHLTAPPSGPRPGSSSVATWCSTTARSTSPSGSPATSSPARRAPRGSWPADPGRIAPTRVTCGSGRPTPWPT